MIFKRLNNSGETLAETIIALSILAITITIASTVIMNSMRNLSNAKQRVIAVSIAREGIEAVRGIRDSNWLLYSDRRRQCWNHDPGTAAAAPCDPANPTPIEPGYYVVYKHTDKSWRLIFADEDRAADGSDADGIPDNDLALDRIKLSLVDVDLGTDSDGHESEDDADSDPKNDDTDMYNHKDASVTNSYGTDVQSTPFSRYIVIEYMENQPTGDSAITPPDDAINTSAEWAAATPSELNRLRVTSVVTWVRGGASHSVELKTILTDHLGREDLNS